MPGGFITFEGGEGAGKSTQIRRLAKHIEDKGYSVLITREPGGCPAAEDLRTLLVSGDGERWDHVSEAFLHYVARREHLLRSLLPALKEGQFVLCDRFIDSTLAYQGYGHQLGRDRVEEVARCVLADINAKDWTPDLTLILDLPIEEGLQRADSRAGSENRYESLTLAFHERVRRGFLEIAAAEPDRCKVIKASMSADAVAQAIITQAGARFSELGP